MQGNSAGHDINFEEAATAMADECRESAFWEKNTHVRQPGVCHGCIVCYLVGRCMAAVCQTLDARDDALLNLAAARFYSKVIDNEE